MKNIKSNIQKLQFAEFSDELIIRRTLGLNSIQKL
jgi:hypothetical protein